MISPEFLSLLPFPSLSPNPNVQAAHPLRWSEAVVLPYSFKRVE